MKSIGSVLQEEVTYKRYNDSPDMVRLVSYCFFEQLPHRQLHMIWKLHGEVARKPVKRQGMSGASSG